MIGFESECVSNRVLSLDAEESHLRNEYELFMFFFEYGRIKLTKSVFKGHEFPKLTDLLRNKMEINSPA